MIAFPKVIEHGYIIWIYVLGKGCLSSNRIRSKQKQLYVLSCLKNKSSSRK